MKEETMKKIENNLLVKLIFPVIIGMMLAISLIMLILSIANSWDELRKWVLSNF